MRQRAILLMVALIVTCILVANAASVVVHSWINTTMRILTRDHLVLPYPAPPSSDQWKNMSASDRLASTRSRLLPKLHDELAAKQLKLGQPSFIRIFKETRELELWLKSADNQWKLFRNYPVACYSGTLGPKTREGDMQAPEGFYSVVKKQLNPASNYHLSFNIGYPNEYDRVHQCTGSLIMVHGKMVSVGCFAMTDPLIEEIYLVVEAALNNAATVPVHVFPFRMTEARLKTAAPKHLDFWRSLQPAHDIFESSHRVPQITVENGRYQAR